MIAAALPFAVAMPPPACSDGEDNDQDGKTDWLGTAPGGFEDWDPGCTWAGDNNESDIIILCPHSSPHSHTYSLGGSVGARSDTVTGGDEVGAGLVTVFETNTADCNGDGLAGDYDGDWETGVGGGFFGYGPWANEPTCNYGLTTHSGTATVFDQVFGSNIAFVIGADDTGGPVVETDPVDGSTSCSTDGSITPGDPTTDPTADADDCLTDVYVGQGTTCGAGGDGGYWVFLSGGLVTVNDQASPPNVAVSNPPTAGTITA